jgi:hypothetical protein
VPIPESSDSLFKQNTVHARQDGMNFGSATFADNADCITRLQFWFLHSSSSYLSPRLLPKPQLLSVLTQTLVEYHVRPPEIVKDYLGLLLGIPSRNSRTTHRMGASESQKVSLEAAMRDELANGKENSQG